MSDENLAVNETTETTVATESAPVEEQTPQVENQVKEPVEATSSADESTQEGEIGNLSDKAQKRFQKLANEKRELSEKLARYEQADQQNRYKPQNQAGLQQAVQPESTDDGTIEMPINELQQMVKNQIWIDNKEREIQEDVKYLTDTFPELNVKKRDEGIYNESLDNIISDGYHTALARNPKLRLKDYAQTVMDIRNQSKREGQAEITTKTIAQIAESPIIGEKATDTRTLEEKAKYMDLSELEKIVPRVDY